MKLIIETPYNDLNDIQNGSIACGQILKAVKNGKPYDERPQGRWVYKLFDENTGISDHCWCSECDYPRSQMSWNFCGNCGADMRGEKMSYFDNLEKDDLVDAIRDFLKIHNVSTLLDVVSYAVYCEEHED